MLPLFNPKGDKGLYPYCGYPHEEYGDCWFGEFWYPWIVKTGEFLIWAGLSPVEIGLEFEVVTVVGDVRIGVVGWVWAGEEGSGMITLMRSLALLLAYWFALLLILFDVLPLFVPNSVSKEYVPYALSLPVDCPKPILRSTLSSCPVRLEILIKDAWAYCRENSKVDAMIILNCIFRIISNYE